MMLYDCTKCALNEIIKLKQKLEKHKQTSARNFKFD